ncbi:MAG: hypothetical protein WAU07_02095 [Microgenomates group bacterium]
MSSISLTKGDVLISNGKAHEVVEISDKKNSLGEVSRYVYFRPLFSTTNSKTILCSIPYENILTTNKRKPVSKKKLQEIFSILNSPALQEEILNVREASEVLKGNDLEQVAILAKQLWMHKQNPGCNFSLRKQQLFKKALRFLSQEIAVIENQDIESAKSIAVEQLEKDTTFLNNTI